MFDVFSPFQGSKRELFQGILALCLFGFLLPAQGQDPRPYNTNYPMNTNVSLEATVMFRLYATSTNPPMTYQWQHDGTNLPAATNVTLLLTNLTVAHAGGYLAWITNAIGGFTNTRTAMLTVDTTFAKIITGAIVTDREASTTASWCDYDGDDFQDLFVVNGWEYRSAKNSLYHNNGDGTFTKITTNALSQTSNYWLSGHWADVDNDGDPDIYVGVTVTGRQAVFYRNDGGGRFTAVSIVPTVDAASRDLALVSWGDHDQDGWVDLFIPGYTHPGNNHLFRNLGDLNFKAMTAGEVGDLVAPATHESSPSSWWIDYDNDGDLDIYVWQSVFALYLNSGSGFFTRTFTGSIANAPDRGGGPSWADYDNDGYLDLFMPRPIGDGINALHRNLGGTNSVEVTQAAGLDRPMTTFAGSWGDYDNDGNLDLFVVNTPNWVSPVLRSANMLYRGNGDGTFTEIEVGSPIWEPIDDWMPGWIDYDNDGFLDLFIGAGGYSPEVNYLYRNNLPTTGNTNHWLKVSLVGKASNASGIGAKIRATANIRSQTVTQLRVIESPGNNTSNQGFLAHFGLGDATIVTTLRVEWPSGNVQELVNVTPDRLLTVTEPSLITPVMPSASLNGSVTLTRSPVSGATYQWRFDSVDLVGQTNRTLNLTNIVAGQEGRYSVVASNATSLVTNYVYLHVDKQFTKITESEALISTLSAPAPSWVDVDGDGDLDLVITGGYWSGVGQPINVFTNSGNGTLTRTHTGGLADALGWWNYQAWGDNDRDGDLDLFVGAHEARVPYLFRNEGSGQWTPVPANAAWTANGVVVRGSAPAWGDYDEDGWLDLVLGYWGNAGGGAPYGKNLLLRSLGGGQLEAITNSPLGIISYVETWEWVDLNGDGDLDLFGATSGNASQKDLLFLNTGSGDLVRDTTHLLVQTPALNAGQAWGDYDNDQDLDLFLTGWNGASRLYTNQGGGNFAVETRGPAIPTSSALGVNWVDYDNDGLLDLFATCTDARNRLFRNVGSGNFTEIKVGSLVNETTFASWFCTWGDYDQDGFLDLFVANESPNRNFLYHNNPNGNRWLQVKLRGTTSNTDGLGALVKVRARIAGTTYWQTRRIASGCQGPELVAHFGLGDATSVTTLRVEWPSGTVQEIPNVAANQMLIITEPRRPVLSLAATPAGFTGVLTADTNQTYQVHASDDLTAGWSVLTNVTSDATGAASWSDPAPSPQGRRFYKAVKAP